MDLLDAKKTELNVFTEAAALIADSPNAFISNFTQDGQVILSYRGLPVDDFPREETICQYVIESKQTLITTDPFRISAERITRSR